MRSGGRPKEEGDRGRPKEEGGHRRKTLSFNRKTIERLEKEPNQSKFVEDAIWSSEMLQVTPELRDSIKNLQEKISLYSIIEDRMVQIISVGDAVWTQPYEEGPLLAEDSTLLFLQKNSTEFSEKWNRFTETMKTFPKNPSPSAEREFEEAKKKFEEAKKAVLTFLEEVLLRGALPA